MNAIYHNQNGRFTFGNPGRPPRKKRLPEKVNLDSYAFIQLCNELYHYRLQTQPNDYRTKLLGIIIQGLESLESN